MKPARLVIVVWLLAAAGCGGPSAYQQVFKNGTRPENSRAYPVDREKCWAGVHRAVLALNFGIDRQDKEQGFLEASQHFKRYRGTATVVLKVTLEPEGEKIRAYVSAIQTAEKVFVRSHTRFFLWIIPLRGGGGAEAERVKTDEWTVQDPKFYDGFFRRLDQELEVLEHASAKPAPS